MRRSLWLTMVLYGGLKKAILSSFELISQAEKSHGKLKIVCILIKILN
jgi:hypothetical protein